MGWFRLVPSHGWFSKCLVASCRPRFPSPVGCHDAPSLCDRSKPTSSTHLPSANPKDTPAPRNPLYCQKQRTEKYEALYLSSNMLIAILAFPIFWRAHMLLALVLVLVMLMLMVMMTTMVTVTSGLRWTATHCGYHAANLAYSCAGIDRAEWINNRPEWKCWWRQPPQSSWYPLVN